MIYKIGDIRNIPKDTAITKLIRSAKNAGTRLFINTLKIADITYPTDANQNEPTKTTIIPTTDNIIANRIGSFPS